MKNLFLTLALILFATNSNATIHVVRVWDGYFQFLNPAGGGATLTIQLGDTIQWLPLDTPSMVHTITSTNIPSGAATFDQIWQAPADTFFQYIPTIAGVYEYECTPHVTIGMIGSFTVTDGTNDISDISVLEDNLVIYPNPATNFIRFKVLDKVYSFNIIDVHGKLISSGKTNEIVDVSKLKNGIYHIEILADELRVLKFLKE